MATNLTIRNVPDQLYQDLKRQAALHRRSINSEAIVCLEMALYGQKIDPINILENARKLRSKTKNYFLTEEELAVLKNEGRIDCC